MSIVAAVLTIAVTILGAVCLRQFGEGLMNYRELAEMTVAMASLMLYFYSQTRGAAHRRRLATRDASAGRGDRKSSHVRQLSGREDRLPRDGKGPILRPSVLQSPARTSTSNSIPAINQ